jgi:hypothetical protein
MLILKHQIYKNIEPLQYPAHPLLLTKILIEKGAFFPSKDFNSLENLRNILYTELYCMYFILFTFNDIMCPQLSKCSLGKAELYIC